MGEGKNRSGLPRLIAIVEMVAVGIIEIDRLLDDPEPQRAGVEVYVPARGAGDRSDVVNAAAGHVASSVKRPPGPIGKHDPYAR